MPRIPPLALVIRNGGGGFVLGFSLILGGRGCIPCINPAGNICGMLYFTTSKATGGGC